MSDTFDRVKKIIASNLEVDESKIVLEASLADDLGADSLDIVEIIMALEEHFEIEIPDEEAQEIITIKDAVTYVDNKLAKTEEL